MSSTSNQEPLVCELLYLEGKVATLTMMLSVLIDAFQVRVDGDQDFDEFAAELMERIPRGYTKDRAAFNDGKRAALRELSRAMRKRRNRS